MMTDPMAQSGGTGPGPNTPPEDADDEPRESDPRNTVALVVLLVLLALGMRGFLAVIRTRCRHSHGKKTGQAPVPHSVIRIVAAPHSVVHVVSAPSLGRSHVQNPTRLSV